MQIAHIPQTEYIVFEHSAFDYEQEKCSVEEKVEMVMAAFNYTKTIFSLDTSHGRIMCFYYDPYKYFKYIPPVRKV